MKKTNINKQIALEILENLSSEKRNQLEKAKQRNFLFTSNDMLTDAVMHIYKEGFYLVLLGAKTKFSVYVADNDGKLIETRKPHANKLHLIYMDTFKL